MDVCALTIRLTFVNNEVGDPSSLLPFKICFFTFHIPIFYLFMTKYWCNIVIIKRITSYNDRDA